MQGVGSVMVKSRELPYTAVLEELFATSDKRVEHFFIFACLGWISGVGYVSFLCVTCSAGLLHKLLNVSSTIQAKQSLQPI